MPFKKENSKKTKSENATGKNQKQSASNKASWKKKGNKGKGKR